MENSMEIPLKTRNKSTIWPRESLGSSKEIKPVNSKGNQSWIFIGRTEAEAPILWPPYVKSQLIGKDPDARKNWRYEKGETESEVVGWYNWLNGHEFEQTLGVSEGQGILVCFMGSQRVGRDLVTEQQHQQGRRQKDISDGKIKWCCF